MASLRFDLRLRGLFLRSLGAAVFASVFACVLSIGLAGVINVLLISVLVLVLIVLVLGALRRNETR